MPDNSQNKLSVIVKANCIAIDTELTMWFQSK